MATKSNDGNAESPAVTCPECGRSFARPQALGAHRRQAHGVAGTSRGTQAGRAGGAGRRRAAKAGARPAARRRAAARPAPQGVDRDALLQTLFPGGLPARTEVLSAVNRWLDEAERLAGIR
jgi:hypothetical protein